MTSTTFETEVQGPLVPKDVILTSYTYFPADIKFLTESDFAFLPGDAFKAAMQLLAKSWQETPAASLPDDDRLLAHFAGFGRGQSAAAEWKAVKDDALSDFVLCADGRYYSRTLAPMALEVWGKRKNRTEQTASARAARAQKRASEGTGSVTEAVTDSVTENKGKEKRGEKMKGKEMEGDGNSSPTRQHADFDGNRIKLSETEVGDFAKLFLNIPDMREAIHRIDQDKEFGRIPSPLRKDALKLRLKAANDDASDSMEVSF